MVMTFTYSRLELESSTVGVLRKLVRKHNLHNQIKRYSKMRKSELVEQLLNHSQKSKSASSKLPPLPPAPKKKGKKKLYRKPPQLATEVGYDTKPARVRKPKKRFAIEG